MLRCPGTHHGVARVSYAQAAWDGLRGLWKNLKGAVHDGIHRLVDEGWEAKGSVLLGLMHLVLA